MQTVLEETAHRGLGNTRYIVEGTVDQGLRDKVSTAPLQSVIETLDRSMSAWHSVGDADNFRLYHTPGIGWRWPLKFRTVPSTRGGEPGGRASNREALTCGVRQI